MSAKAKKSAKSKASAKTKPSAKAKPSAKTQASARANKSAEIKRSEKTENRYRVFEPEEESGRVVEIGVVTLSRDHKLELVSALSRRRQFLDSIVRDLNADDVIHVIAPPPPGAERYAIYTRPVKRSEAGFREALVDSLKTNYRIELKPA